MFYRGLLVNGEAVIGERMMKPFRSESYERGLESALVGWNMEIRNEADRTEP